MAVGPVVAAVGAAGAVPGGGAFAGVVEPFVPLQGAEAAVLFVEADQPSHVERGELFDEPSV